jgi:NAD(P)-dependent dehydrogenase (short-subunit alcohol dehydrogenase family)
MPSVLITGANRGIGLEFARQYANAGWDVIATARETSEELSALEGVRVEQLDMLDLEAVTGFGERLKAPLDVLIANAATDQPKQCATAQDARAWADMLAINSIAPFMLARSVLPRVAPARGKIIAISSMMGSIGDNGSGGYVPYRSSKAALNAAWKSLAIEARPLGVVAALFNPGWVRTRMGGAHAPLPVEESVAGMIAAIEQLGLQHSGGFFNSDLTVIPW